MNFQTNLQNSRKIKELIGDVETVVKWSKTYDGKWTTAYLFHSEERISSPSLSDLALVLKTVGEKKGWGGIGTSDLPQSSYLPYWREYYQKLCSLWASSIHLGEKQANQKVNEILKDILNNG